ncbi:hypothetical protein LF887_05420 [Chryseobacterium sp. MEBOG06]|uniref:hypothetical protein n=1 Tax=Chryseobacterium sp. MEBOG06 TaxID=2879938 RepID=UPI001F3C074B|nr:hypothetical protein [Chryseobacterium sp. MEBOG06]UKB85042.1 hypothetical protein LF887_05295 [Chryseobacterium sp. MEBOG06]UKB85067.1 hypothetical protein LF887_05420 [Chryseobacterium sp. MEBOG06]
MNKFIILIVLTIIVNSCQKQKAENIYEKMSIRNVSFEVPSNFVLKKSNSVDTSVYDIFFHKKNIGSVYLGAYYKPFTEDYSITEEKEIYDIVTSKGAKIYYSKYLDIDYKNGIFNDNYYYFDTINKNVARVMLPKRFNKGLIGIYFDSVDTYNNKFAIISNDVTEENKKTFLKIFKTIKIEKNR